MTDTGAYEARRLYPKLGECELCFKPATDRHHKDGNRNHNNRENLMFLCRHHHMEEDGRLAALIINGKKGIEIKRAKAANARCLICGSLYFPLRKGRCHPCNEYFRRNGMERPVALVGGILQRECLLCHATFPSNANHDRCPSCTRSRYLMFHAIHERQRRCHAAKHGVKEVQSEPQWSKGE